MEEFKTILAAQNRTIVTSKQSTEATFNALNGIVRFAMETACPYKKVKTNMNCTKRIKDIKSGKLKRSCLEALNISKNSKENPIVLGGVEKKSNLISINKVSQF